MQSSGWGNAKRIDNNENLFHPLANTSWHSQFFSLGGGYQWAVMEWSCERRERERERERERGRERERERERERGRERERERAVTSGPPEPDARSLNSVEDLTKMRSLFGHPLTFPAPYGGGVGGGWYRTPGYDVGCAVCFVFFVFCPSPGL